jgi:hypothetical protein
LTTATLGPAKGSEQHIKTRKKAAKNDPEVLLITVAPFIKTKYTPFLTGINLDHLSL